MIFADPKTHDEWLACRTKGIGGSDAGAVIGVNKYKSNVDLWREKTGEFIPDDISDKPAVKYGKEAEQHIRALFALDYPGYQIEYHEYRMYCNETDKFMYATLDGELIEQDGTRGILEIKTCTIMNSKQWDEWDNKIPDSYYTQILHQLYCTGYNFAILRAYIRFYDKDGNIKATVRDYKIQRSDVEEDIEFIVEKEREFYKCVIEKKQPALILPQI